jgi:hypothetical protein
MISGFDFTTAYREVMGGEEGLQIWMVAVNILK